MTTVSDYRSQTPGYSSNADRNKGEMTFLFSVDLCLLLFVINIIITIIVTIIILLSILLCSRQVFLLFIHCIAGSKLWTQGVTWKEATFSGSTFLSMRPVASVVLSWISLVLMLLGILLVTLFGPFYYYYYYYYCYCHYYYL